MNPLKRGVYVFIALLVLTIVEYFLGANQVPQILLWVVAIVKALLVLQFFMHFNRLFGNDDGGHK